MWPKSQLDRIEGMLRLLLTVEDFQMSALDDLTAAVQRTTDVEESAIVLIEGLAQQLKDAIAAGGPALTALQQKLETEAGALAAAVAANTTPTPTP